MKRIISALLVAIVYFGIANAQTYKEVNSILVPNSAFGDVFSIDASGDYVIVGSRYAENAKGNAFIYKKNEEESNDWVLVKEILNSNGQDDDLFGFSVKLVGDDAFILKQGNSSSIIVLSRNEGGTNNWGEIQIISNPIQSTIEINEFDISNNTMVLKSRNESNQPVLFIYQKNNVEQWEYIQTIEIANTSSIGNIGIFDDRLVFGYNICNPQCTQFFRLYRKSSNVSEPWVEIMTFSATDNGSTNGNNFGTSLLINQDYLHISSYLEDQGRGAIYNYSFDQVDTSLVFINKIIGPENSTQNYRFGNLLSGSTTNDIIINYEENFGKTLFIFNNDLGGMDNWGEEAQIQVFTEDEENGITQVVFNNEYIFIPYHGTSDPGILIYKRFNERALPIRMNELFTEVSDPSYINTLFQLTDTLGNHVTGFNELTDYEIRENSFIISEFESIPSIGYDEDLSISFKTALLIDNSISLGANIIDVKDAAVDFIEGKLEDHEIAVYTFSESIDLIQDYTSEVNELRTAIESINFGGSSTNLYGAVKTGLDSFDNVYTLDDITHGFSVVFTDGEDTQDTTPIDSVLSARGDKQVYAIGIGQSIDEASLNEIQNSGLFIPNTFEELSETFLSIQMDIEDISKSFYWFSYISPKRGDSEHSLEIRLNQNLNFGDDSYISTTFNSSTFTGVSPGIYLNRGYPELNGIEKIEADNTDPISLQAETLFGIFTPSYSWSILDDTIAELVVDANDNSKATITGLGSLGQSTSITITDTENGYDRTFVYEFVAGTTPLEEEGDDPNVFKLHQNYPNPFNPNTVISYHLPVNSTVTLKVFDMLGREIAVLEDGLKIAGSHTVSFDASALSSGMYFYRIEAGSFVETRKMMLIK